MRRSHVCPMCGAELGRCRSAADPVYGLPIVVCPGCGYACVRRRHPLERAMVRHSRVVAALARLALQAFALLIMMGSSIAFILDLKRDFDALHASWRAMPAQVAGWGRTRQVTDWLDGGGRGNLVVWVLVGVIAGMWLRATMPHWRYWKLAAAWVVLLAVGVSIPPVAEWMDAWFRWLESGTWRYTGPGFEQWGDELAGVVLTGLLGAGGMPLGGLILRLGPRYRSWRFGRMRGGIRKLRQA